MTDTERDAFWSSFAGLVLFCLGWRAFTGQWPQYFPVVWWCSTAVWLSRVALR